MAEIVQQKQLWQPNLLNYVEMVIKFLLIRDEVNMLRKHLRACVQQKIYSGSCPITNSTGGQTCKLILKKL
jgi:hypothetical protein